VQLTVGYSSKVGYSSNLTILPISVDKLRDRARELLPGFGR